MREHLGRGKRKATASTLENTKVVNVRKGKATRKNHGERRLGEVGREPLMRGCKKPIKGRVSRKMK